MEVVLNYFGQLRIYSVLDLVLLLVAAGAQGVVMLGAIVLHLAFLLLLETQHQHPYRYRFPAWLWIVLAAIGLVLFGRLEGLFFLLASYGYMLKTRRPFGLISPLMRGLQGFFLVAGVTGYESFLPGMALVATGLRNLIGDVRDAGKDHQGGVHTIPVWLGLSEGIHSTHLVAMMLTSMLWWSYTTLPVWYLVAVFCLQALTYRLTPR